MATGIDGELTIGGEGAAVVVATTRTRFAKFG